VSSKFVDGKGTKDQIAGLRTLEARLDAYSAKLKETTYSDSDDGPRSSEGTYMSHEVIIDFVKLSRCRTASIAVSVQGCVEGVAKHIVERVCPLPPHDRGSLSLPPPVPSQEEPAKGTAGEGLSAGHGAKNNCRGFVTGSDSVQYIDDSLGDGKSCQDLTWRINEGLTGLKEHEKAALVENCNEVRHDNQQSLDHRITFFLIPSLSHHLPSAVAVLRGECDTAPHT
jgi:hypothetical protein